MTTVYPTFAKPSIAAKLYDVSTATLRKWAKTGKIKWIKTPCGHNRYDVSAFGAVAEAVKKPEKRKAKSPARKTAPAATVAAPERAPQPAPIAEVPPMVSLQDLIGQATATMRNGQFKASATQAVKPEISMAELMSKLDMLCGAIPAM